MKNAPQPKEVATVIIEAIKNTSNYSESFFRYTVGEDAEAFAQAKKNMSNSELYRYVSNRLLG